MATDVTGFPTSPCSPSPALLQTRGPYSNSFLTRDEKNLDSSGPMFLGPRVIAHALSPYPGLAPWV